MPGKPSRLLRVYFLSDKKYRGTLGDKGEWPGQTAWAGALSQSDREDVWKALNLPAGKTPQTWWLTEFEDYSSPRPGTADVFFAPSEDQTPLQREKYVHYVSQAFPDCIPWCAALGCLLACANRAPLAPPGSQALKTNPCVGVDEAAIRCDCSECHLAVK